MAFGFLAIAGIFTAFSVNSSAFQNANIQAERYQNEKAGIATSRIRAFLLNATQLSETLRVFVEQYNGTSRDQIEIFLDRILESAPDDLIYGAGVWYEPFAFDANVRYFGPYIHRGPRKSDRILTYEWTTAQYDFHSRDWYNLGKTAGGKAAFSEPYYDNGTVYMTLALSFNDRESGKPKGVITVDMILPQLQQLIDNVNESNRDVLFVVGKNGKLLAHPKVQTLLERAKENAPADAVKSVLDIPAKTVLDSLQNSLILEKTMKENDWKIIVASPRTQILAEYLRIRTMIFGTTLVYVGILIALYLLINFFNEGMQRLKERHLEAVTVERNHIKAIVDHVQFGLLRVDRLGHIQKGYSQSCHHLLSLDSTVDLCAHTLWKHFGLGQRETANFEAFFQQVFEVPFLARDMVHQIPAQLMIHGKILSFRYYPILSGEEVETLLISFADVSRSRQTEKENENNKALLRILRNRERFAGCAAEILGAEENILSPQSWPQSEAKRSHSSLRSIKRLVHTWKGDLATFGLIDIAGYMHSLEDSLNENLTPSQSRELMHILKSMLNSYLSEHQSVLRMSAEQVDELMLTVPEKSLLDLQSQIAKSPSIPKAEAAVQSFLDQWTMEKGEDVLAYLSIAAMEVAKRQDKDIRIITKGGSLSLPRAYKAVFTSLIHVVRNAVDHGIEKPRDRKNKNRQGKLEIELSADAKNYRVLISDDGTGIDLSKLKQHVLKKELCTEGEWDAMSSEEQLRFIFISSVTTLSQVGLHSGRGVGLDGVLTIVEEQGGRVSVGTKLGFGSYFEILLPRLTAQVIDS